MSSTFCKTVCALIAMTAALAFGSPVPAASSPCVDAQGNVTAPAFTVPFSSYASPEARKLFQRMLEQGRNAPPLNGPVAASRAYYDKINTTRAELMEWLYPVKIGQRRIGGVPTRVVTPKRGIAPDQQHRVLINLHGGAFLWGAGAGGLVESIPVASIGRIEVVTVDYRHGPEHVFPAASEVLPRCTVNCSSGIRPKTSASTVVRRAAC
jgi:acetyl esterase/lipase